MLTAPSPQGVRKINLQVAACVKPLFKLLLMNATTKAAMIPPFIFLFRFFSCFQNCLLLVNLSSPIESPNGFQLLDLFISIERWGGHNQSSVQERFRNLANSFYFSFHVFLCPKIFDFESWTVFWELWESEQKVFWRTHLCFAFHFLLSRSTDPHLLWWLMLLIWRLRVYWIFQIL